MRKVTKQIAEAFKKGQSLTIKNTKTDGQSVWLHGNEIARKTDYGIEVTLAGWPTVTTRERVDGILQIYKTNMRIVQRNGEQRAISLASDCQSGVAIHECDWINPENYPCF